MESLCEQLVDVIPAAVSGTVMRTVGMTVAVAGLPAPIGALVEIDRHAGDSVAAEVIAFRDDATILYPFSNLDGVQRGNRVRLVRTKNRLAVGSALLGRVVNAQGEPLDALPNPPITKRVPYEPSALNAVERPRIDTPLATGIRAIDGLLCCGKGQRLGIFAGSGVGKSVLMGMMTRNTAADVNVIALIGERGREVNEFLQRNLGPEGLKRSVVVVATSDEPALQRVKAAQAASAIAEYFREQGKDVMLLMDSVTRFAMAQREIGLAAGEPPTTRGYPPSVFAMLPKLVERAGRSERGSVTAFYTVLVEGDDPNEPISDTVRGLLDGHVWLSRSLASRGHYPAIDLLESISRLMPDIASEQQLDAATAIRQLLAAYRDHEDLISIGAYQSGSNPIVDVAIDMKSQIDGFLQQRVVEKVTLEETTTQLAQLVAGYQAKSTQLKKTLNAAAAGGQPAPAPTNAVA
ncbi:MAG: FliI/YscN family ATPase [Pirellulales bacterium]|nr:FliI/YscN family ATPase [Pirellulales bacterium]